MYNVYIHIERESIVKFVQFNEKDRYPSKEFITVNRDIKVKKEEVCTQFTEA